MGRSLAQRSGGSKSWTVQQNWTVKLESALELSTLIKNSRLLRVGETQDLDGFY